MRGWPALVGPRPNLGYKDGVCVLLDRVRGAEEAHFEVFWEVVYVYIV